jgi:hypothetical protein
MLTQQEQKQQYRLNQLERKAAKRSGKIPQRTFEVISPHGKTVIRSMLAGRRWLVTLSRPVAPDVFARVSRLVKDTANVEQMLTLTGMIEKQYGVHVGLVPDNSALYRPMIARENQALKRCA